MGSLSVVIIFILSKIIFLFKKDLYYIFILYKILIIKILFFLKPEEYKKHVKYSLKYLLNNIPQYSHWSETTIKSDRFKWFNNILDWLSGYNILLLKNYIYINIYLQFNYIIYLKLKILSYIKILVYCIKWIFLGLFLGSLYFFISLFYLQIDIAKQIAIWYIILILYYLLISIFNSFLVKYKFGKFTSAIQRFWKRTGIIFWIIEGFLFLLFFYYFLNSSQEPLFMQDFNNLNQEFLLQLKLCYRNLVFLSFIIYFGFILILNINFLNYKQNIVLLFIISLIMFYTFYIESYQFIYIITIFSENDWILDDEKQGLSWILDFEISNIRVKQQYFILCLIAKYWHFIFIFISWFFFLIKSIEINKINYTLLGYNIQNLIILYLLNFCCLIQWLKIFFKKFFDISYYWFYIQYDEKFFLIFKQELFNVFYSLFYIDFYTYLNLKLKLISNYLYYINNINLWKYI